MRRDREYVRATQRKFIDGCAVFHQEIRKIRLRRTGKRSDTDPYETELYQGFLGQRASSQHDHS